MSAFRRLDDVPYRVVESLAKRHGGWGAAAVMAVDEGRPLELSAARADALVYVGISHLRNTATSSEYTPLTTAKLQREMRKALKRQPERATLYAAHGLLHFMIVRSGGEDVYQALLVDLEAELPLTALDQQRLADCHRLAVIEGDPDLEAPPGVVTGLMAARHAGQPIDDRLRKSHREAALNHLLCTVHAGNRTARRRRPLQSPDAITATRHGRHSGGRVAAGVRREHAEHAPGTGGQGRAVCDPRRLAPRRSAISATLDRPPLAASRTGDRNSAFDSYRLLVEAGGSKLLYSGDIRATGRQVKVLEHFVADPTNKIDVLRFEGTCIRSRSGTSFRPIRYERPAGGATARSRSERARG